MEERIRKLRGPSDTKRDGSGARPDCGDLRCSARSSVSAEAPDVLAGESCEFACVVGPHSGVTLMAARWPPAKASAASRDPSGVTLLACALASGQSFCGVA